jgi:hypothetical protein
MPRALCKLGVWLVGVLLAGVAAPAYADHDAVQFFRNIDVTADSPVHDAVCFFCGVRVDGVVTGDIVVFFGGVRLRGEAQHDVVSFFGNVSAADDSTIAHDMVSFFGQIRLGDNVTVGHDLVSMFGVVRAPASVRVGGDRVVFLGWILSVPAIVLIVAVFFILREYRIHRMRMAAQGYQPWT